MVPRMMAQPIEDTLQKALRHHQAGRLAEAEALYRQVLANSPDHPETLHLLGVLVGQSGNHTTAIDLIGRAVTLEPSNAHGHCNLGEFYCRAGHCDRAIASFRRAIELEPGLAVAYGNLGNALKATGRHEEAVAAYLRAIALEPGLAEVVYNLGTAFQLLGQRDRAIAAFQRAIELRPDAARIHNDLGVALQEADRLDEAVAAYQRAVALEPGLAEVHYNLGATWRLLGQLDDALAAYGRAIELRPEQAEAHNNLGGLLLDLGRVDAALGCFRKALILDPQSTAAANNILFGLHFDPDQDAQSILAEHRRWAERFAAPLEAETRPHPNDRTRGRRIRIGFVSADFHGHPVGRQLELLFGHRDPAETAFVAYSDAQVSDDVTRRLKALADGWHDIAGQSDDRVAEQVRAHQIDILVDLALHTSHNRMLVFARKPAPVQVTMLGMPSTTGLATIDYRLTDPYLDPPGSHDADYTERSIRLPHCVLCYHVPDDAPLVEDLPALRNGFVTFGCLNQSAKLSRPALELWAKVLHAVPGSRLVLRAQAGGHIARVRARFEHGGVAGDRIDFLPRAGRGDYFRRYHDIDLGLDPFPYNGHSTTLDALWMGNPVVTLAGRTAVGRVGVSILSNLGLTELIARTPEEYIAIATAWAADLPRLAALRSALRPRMQASALVDGRQYAADVLAALRQLWEAWCDS
jgi:predicted O-linked N-acetylglucosamine transferase (SPINDLY family)